MAPEKAKDAEKLAKATLKIAKQNRKKVSLVVCPPAVHLPLLQKSVKALVRGGQLAATNTDIAQTGSISSGMLKSYGAAYCIAGHSESRFAGVTNEMVRGQVLNILSKGISPILCVGEEKRDTQGWYLSSVKEQLESVLRSVPKSSSKKIVIAYEPVWAIGKNAEREATAVECEEMVIFIRKVIADIFDEKTSMIPRILYGGSVDEKNAKTFLTDGKAQGLLVGRVSLDPKRFASLVEAISK